MKKSETSFTKDVKLPTQNSQSPNIDMLKEMNKSTDMISSLIHEYLLKKEYYKSLDAFQEDLAQKLIHKNYYRPSFQEVSENVLIKLLQRGNKGDFFKQWNRTIPNHIRMREQSLEKIEFYLQIYFAIFPLLYNANNKKTERTASKASMEEFKQFLEKKQSDISRSSEFLPYYALPYIPNPQNHPSYAKLFSPEFVGDLKDKIRQCVKSYLPKVRYPVLYDLVNSDGTGSNKAKLDLMRSYLDSLCVSNSPREDIIIEEDVFNPSSRPDDNPFNNNDYEGDDNMRLKEELIRLRKKDERNKANFIDSQRSWTNFALNILSYSFDLIMLCKSNRNKNDIIRRTDRLNKKLLKYQAFLNKNIEEIEKTNNKTLYTANNTYNNMSALGNSNNAQNDFLLDTIANSKYEDQSMNNNNISINNANNKSYRVDYDQTHLLDMISICNSLSTYATGDQKTDKDDIKYAYALREIRLRIFRRGDQKIKSLSLYQIFYYDLIFKNSFAINVLKNPTANPMIALQLSKLLNQIASLTKGRNYLLMNKNSNSLIECLVNCMKNEKNDSELRQNCLGTIQKFTLRSEPQNKLISMNIIKWIIDVFVYEFKTLSDYTVEYGLALIMNLSLRKNGRDKFEEESERVMQVLINYISKENLQIQTCVNGTLYSLLKRKKFIDEAKKFNVDTIIKSLNVSNPQLQKQMTYILEEMNGNGNVEGDADENFEEDPTAIDNDNDNLIDEDYAELDSIDDDSAKEHYKVIAEFVIRNDEVNSEEERKIDAFTKSNPAMLGDTAKNISVVEEEKSEVKDTKEEKKNPTEIEEAKAFEKRDKIPRDLPGEDSHLKNI